ADGPEAGLQRIAIVRSIVLGEELEEAHARRVLVSLTREIAGLHRRPRALARRAIARASGSAGATELDDVGGAGSVRDRAGVHDVLGAAVVRPAVRLRGPDCVSFLHGAAPREGDRSA